MKNIFAIRPSQSLASSPSSSRTLLKTRDSGSKTEFLDRIRQKSFFGVDPYISSEQKKVKSSMM